MNPEDLEKLSDRELIRINKLVDIRDTRIKFAKKYHVNMRGERMRFDEAHHIKALYNSLSPEIVVMGATQVMKSEWLIIDLLASAYNGVNCFFVLPKYEHRDTYVQTRINRPIEDVPFYKNIVKDAFANRIEIKQFGKGIIKFVGSNVYGDFKEFAADNYYVEEADECNWPNVEFGYGRMDASPFKFKRFLANPTNKAGAIWKQYMRSNQQIWKCPCKECGVKTELDFFKVVAKEVKDQAGNVLDYVMRDDEWEEGCGRDIKVICPECGGEIDRFSEDGEWEAQNPTSKVEGYHIPSMSSSMVNVAEIWFEHDEAKDDPTKMRNFFNRRLGLPYEAEGNRVTVAVLDSCSSEKIIFKVNTDSAHVKEGKHLGPCSMGVDTGGNFDVRISYAVGNRRVMAYVGKIDAQNRYMLHELIDLYNVQVCVMDIGPELAIARDFQDEGACDVWLCKYKGDGSDRTKSYNRNERIISVDRTEALDRGYSQLKTVKNVLPANFATFFDGKYASEMTLPIRVVTEAPNGDIRFVWTKGQDHARHADVYDILAHEIMSRDLITLDSVSVV